MDALAKALADRDTQQREMPVNTDSSTVVEDGMSMDFGEPNAHNEDSQMIESEEVNEITEPQEEEHIETPEVNEIQDEVQDEPKDTEPSIEDRIAEYEKNLEASRKQRSDDQSYFQHQINALKAENEALKNKKEEAPPVKQLTDEELADLYYENPAEAMRITIQQTQAQTPQVNTQLQIQEGVQRALHNDYDEVIGIVQKQATLDPQLEKEILSSSNPAEVAYKKGLEFKKALQIQTDPSAYEAELRAKIEAELASKKPMPTRVGNARSSAPKVGGASQADHGKTTFDKMFGKKRR